MPREFYGTDFRFLPREEILSFEEITRLARVFHGLGVRRFRLTGGEPLLRADLPVLVGMLSELPQAEIAMTTNGSLLVHQASALAKAGLSRVTVSLDSVDDEVFRRMNDVEMPVARIIAGIEAAVEAGLTPVKVNAVVKRGVNDETLAEFVRRFRGADMTPRFIEYMDVGTTNRWRLEEVVTGTEIVAIIGKQEAIEPVPSAYRGEVAKRWRFRDGSGEFGVITSVSEPFCGDCTRARLSADGHLFTCLFASEGFDLRDAIRSEASDEHLSEMIADIWQARVDRYSELRADGPVEVGRAEMSYLGG